MILDLLRWMVLIGLTYLGCCAAFVAFKMLGDGSFDPKEPGDG